MTPSSFDYPARFPSFRLRLITKLKSFPFPTLARRFLFRPPTPDCGFDVKHSMALTISGCYQPVVHNYFTSQALPDIAHPTLPQWRSWLLSDQLDDRVSSVQFEETQMQHTFEEVLGFVSRRRNDSIPAQSFTIPAVDKLTIHQFGQILSQLSNLRTLRIRSKIVDAADQWPAIIALIHDALPSLHKLEISADRPLLPSAKLSGLQKLREFRFGSAPKRNGDMLAMAVCVYRLGVSSCTFYITPYNEAEGGLFHSLIAKLKSPNPRYSALHTLSARDLDLFTSSEVNAYAFEPVGGQFRRVAFDTTTTNAAVLAKAQTKLDTLVTRQKAAIQTFQSILDRTVEGVSSGNGDGKADNNILKVEFENILKEQRELGSACQAMKNMAEEVDKKSRTMMCYAQAWLGANKGK